MQRKLFIIFVSNLYILDSCKGRPDTKWRDKISVCEGLHPSWRVLYKPPVSKRCGDLQWRVLHCAIASNSLVSKFNEMVLLCPFCNDHDTVFHMFFECPRLGSLFEILERLIIKLGFCITCFVYFRISIYKVVPTQCVLANFLIGQAKLAI